MQVNRIPPSRSIRTPQHSSSDTFHIFQYTYRSWEPHRSPIQQGTLWAKCINPTYDCLIGGDRLISMNVEMVPKFTPIFYNRPLILHVNVVDMHTMFYRPQQHGFS